MLHAERLTRILIDEAVAELLLEQAKAHPKRRDVLERWLARAELRVEELCTKRSPPPAIASWACSRPRPRTPNASPPSDPMTIPLRYTLAHGPVIAALGRVAMSGLRNDKPTHPPAVPGPWIEARLPPRPADIVRDYIRHVGGDPAWYRNRIPAHYFPAVGVPARPARPRRARLPARARDERGLPDREPGPPSHG